MIFYYVNWNNKYIHFFFRISWLKCMVSQITVHIFFCKSSTVVYRCLPRENGRRISIEMWKFIRPAVLGIFLFPGTLVDPCHDLRHSRTFSDSVRTAMWSKREDSFDDFFWKSLGLNLGSQTLVYTLDHHATTVLKLTHKKE